MPDSNAIWWIVNIVVGMGVILCLIVAVRILYRGWAFLQVSTTSDWNSDETAVENFISLLDEAQRSMVVHDDGNKMAGSVYEDKKVVDAVRQKLAKSEEFKLLCHFNYDDALLFTEELRLCSGVQIKVGQGDRPDDDVHYKIIDGGLKAHLSRHEFPSKDRQYKVVDCNAVPKGSRAHVTDALLGRYKDHAQNLGIWVA